MRRVLSPGLAGVLTLALAIPAAGAQGPTATTGVPPSAGSATPTTTTGAPTSGPAATTGVPPAATPSTTTSTAAATPSSSSGDGNGPNALLVGLAVLLALGALTTLLWGIAHLTAWEPRWLPGTRHAIGEAGYRTGATWAELRDWLRPPPRR